MKFDGVGTGGEKGAGTAAAATKKEEKQLSYSRKTNVTKSQEQYQGTVSGFHHKKEYSELILHLNTLKLYQEHFNAVITPKNYLVLMHRNENSWLKLKARKPRSKTENQRTERNN